MPNGKHRAGLFGAAGILVAALIISGFFVAGNIFPAKGKLTIQVMDAPVELKSLVMELDSISIQGEQGWVDLSLTLDEPFDLLMLQEFSETASVDEISAGSYSMIKLHIHDAAATVTYVDENGQDVTREVTIPSSDLKVILAPHLEITSETETTVLIDLQPYDLDSIGISNSLNLRPVVKAIVQD